MSIIVTNMAIGLAIAVALFFVGFILTCGGRTAQKAMDSIEAGKAKDWVKNKMPKLSLIKSRNTAEAVA